MGVSEMFFGSRADRKDQSSKQNNKLLLNVVVLGASGDLAKKKTFPALYALYQKRQVSFSARLSPSCAARTTDLHRVSSSLLVKSQEPGTRRY